jgi:methylglyoxal synthase
MTVALIEAKSAKAALLHWAQSEAKVEKASNTQIYEGGKAGVEIEKAE